MQQVYIDEKWVVDQYLRMEATKTWTDLETDDGLKVLALEREMMDVLTLEREMMAESIGVSAESLEDVLDVGTAVAGSEVIDITAVN